MQRKKNVRQKKNKLKKRQEEDRDRAMKRGEQRKAK